MHIFIHQSLFLHLFANWKECLAILSAEVFSTAGSISQSRILNKRVGDEICHSPCHASQLRSMAAFFMNWDGLQALAQVCPPKRLKLYEAYLRATAAVCLILIQIVDWPLRRPCVQRLTADQTDSPRSAKSAAATQKCPQMILHSVQARRMDDIRKWLGDNKLRSIGGGFPLVLWLLECIGP